MNATIRAQILVNESETRDNFHQTVERIIEETRPHRYAVPLAVSGDAIRKAITPTERERVSRVSIWGGVSA